MKALNNAPSQQQIAERAYEIYLLDGKPEGHALEHWLQAEAELTEGLRRMPVHVLKAVSQFAGEERTSSEGSRRRGRTRKASPLPGNAAIPKDGVLHGDKKTGKAGERSGATGNRTAIQEVAYRVMGSRHSERQVERSGQRRQPKRGRGSQKAKE